MRIERIRHYGNNNTYFDAVKTDNMLLSKYTNYQLKRSAEHIRMQYKLGIGKATENYPWIFLFYSAIYILITNKILTGMKITLTENKIKSIIREEVKRALLESLNTITWNLYTDGLSKLDMEDNTLYSIVKNEFEDEANIDWDDREAVAAFWKQKFLELAMPILKENGWPDDEDGNIRFSYSYGGPNNGDTHFGHSNDAEDFESIMNEIAEETGSKACDYTGKIFIEDVYEDMYSNM